MRRPLGPERWCLEVVVGFVVVGDCFYMVRPLGPQCWRMEVVVGVLWSWVFCGLG